MSETVQIHFSDGRQGRITFEDSGAAKQFILNNEAAARQGVFHTQEGSDGKWNSYNPTQITWIEEL